MSTIHLIWFRSKFCSINWIFNAKSIDFITFFFKYFINHELLVIYIKLWIIMKTLCARLLWINKHSFHHIDYLLSLILCVFFCILLFVCYLIIGFFLLLILTFFDFYFWWFFTCDFFFLLKIAKIPQFVCSILFHFIGHSFNYNVSLNLNLQSNN